MTTKMTFINNDATILTKMV